MRKIFHSFRYAIRGIGHAWKYERQMKIHSFAAVSVVTAGYLTGINACEWVAVLLLSGGVVALELVNTAIERVVDLASPEYHELAKQAKDVAAGAVLLYSMLAAGIGLYIFIPKWFF